MEIESYCVNCGENVSQTVFASNWKLRSNLLSFYVNCGENVSQTPTVFASNFFRLQTEVQYWSKLVTEKMWPSYSLNPRDVAAHKFYLKSSEKSCFIFLFTCFIDGKVLIML
jgi:hypothetical protein